MVTYVWWHEDVFGSRQDAEQLIEVIELGRKVVNWTNLETEAKQFGPEASYWDALRREVEK